MAELGYTTVNTSEKPDNKVMFSKEQYEYLNNLFPEVLGTYKTTIEEYQRNSGTRLVVEVVRKRMK